MLVPAFGGNLVASLFVNREANTISLLQVSTKAAIHDVLLIDGVWVGKLSGSLARAVT